MWKQIVSWSWYGYRTSIGIRCFALLLYRVYKMGASWQCSSDCVMMVYTEVLVSRVVLETRAAVEAGSAGCDRRPTPAALAMRILASSRHHHASVATRAMSSASKSRIAWYNDTFSSLPLHRRDVCVLCTYLSNEAPGSCV